MAGPRILSKLFWLLPTFLREPASLLMSVATTGRWPEGLPSRTVLLPGSLCPRPGLGVGPAHLLAALRSALRSPGLGPLPRGSPAGFLTPAPTPSLGENWVPPCLPSSPELAPLAIIGQVSALLPEMHVPHEAACEQLHRLALPPAPSPQPSLSLTVPALSKRHTDYDECESREDDCAPGTSCRNTLGSYTCSCVGGTSDFPVEYSGRPCEGNILTVPYLESCWVLGTFIGKAFFLQLRS